MTVTDAVQERLAQAPPEPREPEPPDAEVVAEVVPGSVLAQLRARAAELTAQRTVDLPIPGYDALGLHGRYRAVSIAKVFGDANVANPLVPEWQVAADTLARALEQLLLLNDGKLEPFAPGVTLRFDDDLVAALELHPEGRTARAVLKALLGGGELGESRISAHFMRYQGWLLGGGEDDASVREVARDAVGESRGQ